MRPQVRKTMVAPLAIGLGLGGWFVTLMWLEKRRPLRPSVEALQILEQPLVLPLCRWKENGLVSCLISFITGSSIRYCLFAP